MKCISKTHCIYQDDSQSRYQPAQSKPFKHATPNTERYLKLHNGDIYDVDSNTILSRKALYDILSI